MKPTPFWSRPWGMAALLLGGFLAGAAVSWLFTAIGATAAFQVDATATPILSISQTPAPDGTMTPSPTAAATSTPTATVTPAPIITPTATEVQIAPDFTLETLDGGQSVTLSDYRGKVVVINFWASWCPPCKDEMPALQAAYDKYKDQGFVVLGVNMTPVDSLDDAKNMVDELRLTFPILADPKGTASQDLYQIINLPTSYWIDQQGYIRSVFVGAMTEEQIEAQLTQLLH